MAAPALNHNRSRILTLVFWLCSIFTRKWKPVLPHEEFPVTEEEEERQHPSIIKNGAKPLDLSVRLQLFM